MKINRPSTSMRFRKLRIVWSIVCGVATVLLIALWVRSYWVQYRLICPTVTKGVIEVDSAAGVVWIVESDLLSAIPWNQSLYQLKLDNKYLPFVHSLQQKTFMGFARFEEYLGLGGIKGRTTVIPHWFLVLVSAALAYVPWLRSMPVRFGLRTLLIATTLVALVLGLIVWLGR